MQFLYKNVNKYINYNGIISRKVWVIAADDIKMAAFKSFRKGKDSSVIATLFVWKPGISPVAIPIKKPRNENEIMAASSFNICPLYVKFHSVAVVSKPSFNNHLLKFFKT